MHLKRRPTFKFTDHTKTLIEPLQTINPSSTLPSTGYGRRHEAYIYSQVNAVTYTQERCR